MNQSFYTFAMSYRDPYKQDGMTRFANQLDKDTGFPRNHSDYYELADYLELSGDYSELIPYFDEMYQIYQERKEQADQTTLRNEETE